MQTATDDKTSSSPQYDLHSGETSQNTKETDNVPNDKSVSGKHETTVSLDRDDSIGKASVTQISAAASFFTRAGQKLPISAMPKKKRKPGSSDNPLNPALVSNTPHRTGTTMMMMMMKSSTNFCETIHHHPPPVPPTLLKFGRNNSSTASGLGKIKVILQLQSTSNDRQNDGNICLTVEKRKNQVCLKDPSSNCSTPSQSQRRPPKFFAMDATFTEEDSMAEFCSFTLTDIIQAVVSGSDGCLISFGTRESMRSNVMFGDDRLSSGFGIIPSAISWLFRLIHEQKERTGARFSVRISAVEVCGKEETLRDLLSSLSHASDGPGANAPSVYLRDDPISGTQLENQSELRAPTADRAAFYLDAALTARSHSQLEQQQQQQQQLKSADRSDSSEAHAGSGTSNFGTLKSSDWNHSSHLFFTLHVYQYRVERSGGGSGVAGGRSRLHLIDLGGGKISKESSSVASNESNPNDYVDFQNRNSGSALPMSSITSVILGLLNGHRHNPHRESKLAQMLREAIGSLSCRTCIVIQASPYARNYNENLQLLQFAHKIQRSRRHRVSHRISGTDSSSSEFNNPSDGCQNTSSEDSSSCDSFGLRRAGRLRLNMGLRLAMKRSSAFRTLASRQPNFGTTSHVSLAASSERDYTSSSEQSCDTVIYLGRHGLTDDQPHDLGDNSIIQSKMGKMFLSSTAETDSEHSSNGPNKSRTAVQTHSSPVPSSVGVHSGSGSGGRRGSNSNSGDPCSPRATHAKESKRTTPRTNAHAWPRAAVKNAIETLSTQKEQWVDGPKSDFHPATNQVAFSSTGNPSQDNATNSKSTMVDKETQSEDIQTLSNSDPSESTEGPDNDMDSNSVPTHPSKLPLKGPLPTKLKELTGRSIDPNSEIMEHRNLPQTSSMKFVTSKAVKTDHSHPTKDHSTEMSTDATLGSQCSTCATDGSLMRQSVTTVDQSEQDPPNDSTVNPDDWPTQQCSQKDLIAIKNQPCEWRKFSNIGLSVVEPSSIPTMATITTTGPRSNVQPDVSHTKQFAPPVGHTDPNTPVARVKPFVKDWIQRHSGLKAPDNGQVKTSVQHSSYQNQKTNKHVSSSNDSNLPNQFDVSVPMSDRAATLGCQPQTQSIRTHLAGPTDAADCNSRSLNYQIGVISPTPAPTIMPPTISCVSSLETGSNFARISAWIKSVSVETYVSPSMLSTDASNDIVEASNKSTFPRDTTDRSSTVKYTEIRPNTIDTVEARYANESYPKHEFVKHPAQIHSTSSTNEHSLAFPVISRTSDKAHRGIGVSSNLLGKNTHPRRGRSVPPKSIRNTAVTNPSDDSCLDESHHCLGSPTSPKRGIPTFPVSLSIGPLCTKEDSKTISSSLTDKMSKNSDFDAFPSRRPDGSSNPQLHKEQQLFSERQEMKSIDEQGFLTYTEGRVSDRKHKLMGFWSSTRKPHESRVSAATIYPVEVTNSVPSPINLSSPRKKCFIADTNKRSPKFCHDVDRHFFDCASPKVSRHQRPHSICSSTGSTHSGDENRSESAKRDARNIIPDSNQVDQNAEKIGVFQSAFNKISYKENRAKNGKGRLSFLMSPLFSKKKDKDARQVATTTIETPPRVQAHILEQRKQTSQASCMTDTKRKSQKKDNSTTHNRKYSVTSPDPIGSRTKIGCLRRDKIVSKSTFVDLPCESNEANLDRSNRPATTAQIKNSSLQSSSGHGSECSSTLVSDAGALKASKTEQTNSLRCRCKRHHHHHHYHQQHYHSPSKCTHCSPYTKFPHRSDSSKSHVYASDTRRPADGQRSSESGASTSGYIKSECKRCIESGRSTSELNHSTCEVNSGKSLDTVQARINIGAPAARENGVRRGGGHTSSGYESIVRDSEASSSHTESSSCSSADGCSRTVSGSQHARHSTTSHQSKSDNRDNNKNISSLEHQRQKQRSPTPRGTGTGENDPKWSSHIGHTDRTLTNPKPSTSKSVQTFDSCQTSSCSVNIPETQNQIQASSRQISDKYSSTSTTAKDLQPLTPIVSQSASSSSSTSHRSRSAPPCSEDTSEETTSSPISVRYVLPKTTETAKSSLSTDLETSLICKSPTNQSTKSQTHQTTYGEEVQEMERQIRYEKIYDLLAQQDMLKMELMTAKDRLLIHPSTWSFDLYVAEQMDPDDPGFLEALEKETEILRKRVDACKSHIMLITCFDVRYKPGIATLTTTSRPNQELKPCPGHD